ncbi:MAG TPA: DNA primase [Candidatus Aminicenantes bacterium]|nr:MAG: DNA primase [Candidatus Aminicenantes bacterium]HEK86748.1 DNA primase [Candidatus Aminicenantes bacterium]
MEITEKIKQVASIVEIASQYTTLKKRGKKWVGLCPFHSEKDPSFTVDEEKQLFHCFGCGIGGDLFSLVMEKENMTFPEAVRLLAEKYHIPLPESRTSYKEAKLEEKIFEINEKALNYFRNNLLKTQEGKRALEYLRGRKFTEETIKKLRLGYALNSWDSLFQNFKQSYSPQDLEKAGLIIPGQRAGEYRDRFRGRIIFPIFTLTNRVVAFGGRTIFEAQPKYLNSPETQVFSKGHLLYGLNFSRGEMQSRGEAILVEGYADYAALFQAGIQNVVASMGTSLTVQQVAQILRYAPRVIINYDGDEAGIKAALRAIPICLEKGLQVRIMILPENLDPDGYLKKYGPEKYLSLVKKSQEGFYFLMSEYSKTGDLNIPEEKSRIIRQVVLEISRIPDSIVQNEYLRQAADFFRIGENILRPMIEKNSSLRTTFQKGEERKFWLPAEKRLLQLLFTQQEILPLLINEFDPGWFQGLVSEPIFRYLLECFDRNLTWNFSGLQEIISPKLLSQLSRALQEEVPSGSVGEALDCLHTLKKIRLQKKLKEIQREISLIEKKGDKEKLMDLLYQKHEITKEILSL